MDVSERITMLRENVGISKTELAKKSGLSQAYISDLEHGKKNPTINSLSKICDILGVSLVEFFSMKQEIDSLPPKIKDFVSKKENHGIIYLIMQMRENEISEELMVAWLKDLLATIEAERKKYSNRVGVIVMPGQQPGRDYDPEEVEYLRKELENELSDLILTPSGIKKP